MPPLTYLPNGLQAGYVKVGDVWIRDNNGTLQQSTDSTDGTDGSWDDIGVLSGTDLVSPDAGNDLTVNPKFWVGTQGEYDAIASPDANTIYTIIPG